MERLSVCIAAAVCEGERVYDAAKLSRCRKVATQAAMGFGMTTRYVKAAA